LGKMYSLAGLCKAARVGDGNKNTQLLDAWIHLESKT
jgi:hypothetical protein